MFRLLTVVIGALLKPRLVDPLEASSFALRVSPGDLDVNLHMTNSRYLQLMDLGRIELAIRQRMGRVAVRHGWRLLVGSITLKYRRSLEPFQRFQLRTRVVCWDEKWFYLEQRFEKDGQAVAVGLVKAVVRGKGGNVAPGAVLEAMGMASASPPMPPAIEAWRRADALVGRVREEDGGG